MNYIEILSTADEVLTFISHKEKIKVILNIFFTTHFYYKLLCYDTACRVITLPTMFLFFQIFLTGSIPL